MVGLEKRGKMPPEDVRVRVQIWPEEAAGCALAGDKDDLLRVHVEDRRHFSRFVMEQLLKQSGAVDAKSSFALERIEETTALPLRCRAG